MPTLRRVGASFLASIALLALARSTQGAPPDTETLKGHPTFRVLGSSSSSSPNGGYNPTQIRNAYGFNSIAATGSGQVIALIEAYGSSTIVNDLTVFSNEYSIPITSATLTIVNSDGAPTGSDSGWALETALDVEWAHAIAPGAKILLVVTKNDDFNNLFNGIVFAASWQDPVTHEMAQQISMSWSVPEFAGETTLDSQLATAGISYFASAGDQSAGVGYPAASPYVTGVGGTTLLLTLTGNVVSETAWSDSGGGTSAYEPTPSWQASFQTTGTRDVPDVSYCADPSTGFAVYDSTAYQGNTGWQEVGGTSAGSPQWAALVALANSQRTTPVEGVNETLYGLASAGYKTYFRDITVGSNASSGNPGYNAGPGYDEVTGLGSPLAGALIAALTTSTVSAPPPPPQPPSTGSLSAAGVAPVPITAAPGALNVLVLGFSVTASAVEDVNVSQVIVTTTGIASAETPPVTAARLLLNSGTTPNAGTATLLSSATPGNDGTIAFVLSQTVALSTAQTWLVVFDVATGPITGTVVPTLTGIAATGDTSGASLTASGTPIQGDTLTIGTPATSATTTTSSSGFIPSGGGGGGGGCIVSHGRASPAALFPLAGLGLIVALVRRRRARRS
jgi:hypothetical protein